MITRSVLKLMYIIPLVRTRAHIAGLIQADHLARLLLDVHQVQMFVFVATIEKMALMLSHIQGADQVKEKSRVISTKSMLHGLCRTLKGLTTQYVIHVGVFHDSKV